MSSIRTTEPSHRTVSAHHTLPICTRHTFLGVHCKRHRVSCCFLHRTNRSTCLAVKNRFSGSPDDTAARRRIQVQIKLRGAGENDHVGPPLCSSQNPLHKWQSALAWTSQRVLDQDRGAAADLCTGSPDWKDRGLWVGTEVHWQCLGSAGLEYQGAGED